MASGLKPEGRFINANVLWKTSSTAAPPATPSDNTEEDEEEKNMTTHQDVGKKLPPVVEDKKREEDESWDSIRSRISFDSKFAQTCWTKQRFVQKLSKTLSSSSSSSSENKIEALLTIQKLLNKVPIKYTLDLLTCHNGALSSNIFKMLSNIAEQKQEHVVISSLETLEDLVRSVCNVLLGHTSDEPRRNRLLRLWSRLPRYLSSLLQSKIQGKKTKLSCLSLVETACKFASKHALDLGSSFYAEMLATEPTLPNVLCLYMQDVPDQTIRVLSILLDTSETYKDVVMPLATYVCVCVCLLSIHLFYCVHISYVSGKTSSKWTYSSMRRQDRLYVLFFFIVLTHSLAHSLTCSPTHTYTHIHTQILTTLCGNGKCTSTTRKLFGTTCDQMRIIVISSTYTYRVLTSFVLENN